MIYGVYFRYNDGIWKSDARVKVEADNEKDAKEKAIKRVMEDFNWRFVNSVSTVITVKQLKQKKLKDKQ